MVVIGVGVGRPVMDNVPFMHLSLAEIDLKFINRYRDTWPAAIQCLSGNVVDLGPIVTHTPPLERGREALELTVDGSKFSIRPTSSMMSMQSPYEGKLPRCTTELTFRLLVGAWR
ncbi:hypothetical protein F4780DRAFT_474730 [Xylariomycetidae sp. FL0641]|nr:hypothetical protein F4780DRAFT_474730 [Xylariomycetidae sp. FL0641]